MSFEKGKMNFSVLVSTSPIGDGFEDAVFEDSYSESKPSLETPVEDFTAGISLADAPKERELFSFGSHFFASTRKKEYKMPRSRLKEEIEAVLHDEVKKNGGDPLNSKRRKEIVESVQTALQGQAQLELSGSRFVLSHDRKRIIVEASSSSKLDNALVSITSSVPISIATGIMAYTPDFLYEVATGENVAGYQPLTIAGRYSSEGIGRDFLTWLWARSENDGTIDGLTIALTGMIQLAGEDDGSGPVNVILKDGAPAIGAEVDTGFNQGKKVSKAEFSIADGNLVYQATIDDEFHFKGFQGPYTPEKGLSNGDNFDGRMMDCVAFMKIIERTFKVFCNDPIRQQCVDLWLASRTSVAVRR